MIDIMPFYADISLPFAAFYFHSFHYAIIIDYAFSLRRHWPQYWYWLLRHWYDISITYITDAIFTAAEGQLLTTPLPLLPYILIYYYAIILADYYFYYCHYCRHFISLSLFAFILTFCIFITPTIFSFHFSMPFSHAIISLPCWLFHYAISWPFINIDMPLPLSAFIHLLPHFARLFPFHYFEVPDTLYCH